MRERKYEKGSEKFSQINEGCLRFLATHIKIWHFSILCLYTTSCYLMYLLLKSLSPNWQFHMPCLIIVRLVITWSSWFQHIKFWLLLLPTYDNAQFHEFIIIRQSPSALSNTTPIKNKKYSVCSESIPRWSSSSTPLLQQNCLLSPTGRIWPSAASGSHNTPHKPCNHFAPQHRQTQTRSHSGFALKWREPSSFPQPAILLP